MSFCNLSKHKLFHKKREQPTFHVQLKIDANHAVFSLHGRSEEVVTQFRHILQSLNNAATRTNGLPLGIDYYTCDANYGNLFPGGSLYKLGIKLSNKQGLADMFWFLAKKNKNVDALLELVPPNTEEHHTLAYALLNAKLKAAEAELPPYFPEASQPKETKNHCFKY